MNVYFDKENLISLYKQKNTSEIISDGIKLIKKHCSVYFNFLKDGALEDPIPHILKDFTTGVSPDNEQVFLDKIFPERPLKSNFHNKVKNMQSIFFITGDIQKGKNAGSLFIVDLGEEEELFRKLMLFNNEYKCAKDIEIGAENFRSWDDLEQFAFPFTDMIIFDRYLFNDNTLNGSNFEKFVPILHSHKNFKTNIVIVTNPDQRDNTYNIIEVAKSCVERIIGKRPNVTLIDTRRRSEHDRTIFTNYLRFKSGDSFNYFNNANNKITSGHELDLRSLIDSDYDSLAHSLIDRLQETINWLEANNPDAIQGDKKSNFLIFKT